MSDGTVLALKLNILDQHPTTRNYCTSKNGHNGPVGTRLAVIRIQGVFSTLRLVALLPRHYAVALLLPIDLLPFFRLGIDGVAARAPDRSKRRPRLSATFVQVPILTLHSFLSYAFRSHTTTCAPNLSTRRGHVHSPASNTLRLATLQESSSATLSGAIQLHNTQYSQSPILQFPLKSHRSRVSGCL